MKFVPKSIPEEVNVTPVHPLVNFGYLLGTVVLGLLASYVVLGFAADWLVTRISPEDEIKIGQDFFRPFSDVEVPTDCQRYLDNLMATLYEPSEQSSVPLSLHVIQESRPNAAILPGGNVLVTTGLLQTVRSENELAFVLAHELGHFQARDPLRAMGRSLVWSFLLSVVGGRAQESSQVVASTAQLTTLTYSRTQESAADLYAINQIVRRYQHAGYSLDFFARLQQEASGYPAFHPLSEYFSTHPLVENRIETLQQSARENGWSLLGRPTALPELDCFQAGN